MKLTLGCGNKVKPTADGWLNHDLKRRPGVDLAFDLARFPWPVKHLRGTIEEILATDVLEHIPKELMVKVMDSCWDLLVSSGTMEIQIPVWGSYYFHADMTHVWGGHIACFDIFDEETVVGAKNPWYTSKRWVIVERRQDDAPLDRGSNLHFLLSKRG